MCEVGDGSSYVVSREHASSANICKIIEGAASVLVAVFVHFLLPDFPTAVRSKFLSEEERILACNRLAMEGIGLTQGAHLKIGEWQAFKLVISDWRTYCLCLLFTLGTGSQTMQYFVPSLVETFGWKGNEAQCKTLALEGTVPTDDMTDYTIPSYAFAVVCILSSCFLADRTLVCRLGDGRHVLVGGLPVISLQLQRWCPSRVLTLL